MWWLVKGYLLFWICCAWGFVEFLAAAQELPDVDVQDEFGLPGREADSGAGDGSSRNTDEH